MRFSPVRRLGAYFVLLTLGFTAPLPVAAQPAAPRASAPAAGSQPVPLMTAVRAGTLPSGLRYFIRHNPRPAGRADMRLVVNAGSILEDDDQRGAAHFIEHMSFNGTKRYPKNELVSYLQSIGVRFGGDLNAQTGFDDTIYVLPIPATDPKIVEQGLTILREWAGNALIADADVETERAVVLAEMRSGEAYEERLRRQTIPLVFNRSRYADRVPIGTEQSLRTMTGDHLRRFYRDWYRPDLQAVIVVGDIDVDVIERHVRTIFADMQKPVNPRPRPVSFEIPPRTTFDAVIATDPELPSGRVDLTLYVRPSQSMASIGAYDAMIRDQLVNRMLGLRLLELMDQPVRPFLGARASRGPVVRGYESFTASAAIAGQDPVETVRLLATEIERARRYGFAAEELDAVRRDVLNNYAEANAEANTSDSDALADELGRHFLTDEPVPGIAWEYQRVSQILPTLTLEAINEHARQMLGEPGSQPYVLVAAPSIGTTTEDALRAAVNSVVSAEIAPYRGVKVETQLLEKLPTPGRVVSETTDKVLGSTTLTFANGVKVILKPTTIKNDEVLLTGIRYGGQYLYDQADHQNATHLVESIAAMGYGTFTPTALQRFLSTRSANATLDFGAYTEEVDGGSTKGDLPTLLQLVYLKMTSPRLDPARLDANRNAVKGYLTTMWNSPESHFDDFSMAVLSQEHPRAPRVPRPADLDQVNAERSVAIYKERFGNANGMTFVLVGSFTVAEARPLVTTYLGGLPSAPIEAKFRDVGIRYPSGTIDRVLQKGSDNSSLTIIYTGQRPYSPVERLKLNALTEVLRLRVIDRIREELGSSYSPGVMSRFGRIPVGEYAIRFGIGCAPEQVPIVEQAIDDIIAALQASGSTTAELEKVTRTWLNEYETRRNTNGYWLGRLRDRALHPALDEDSDDFLARVKALTPADVQAAARTYADRANRVRLILESEPSGGGR